MHTPTTSPVRTWASEEQHPASVSLSALSSSRLALFMDRLSPCDGKRGNKSLRLVSSQWWLETHTFLSKIERVEAFCSPNSPEENPQFHSIRSQVHAWVYCMGKKECGVLSHARSGSCPHPWIWGVGGCVNNIHTTQTGWEGCVVPQRKTKVLLAEDEIDSGWI